MCGEKAISRVSGRRLELSAGARVRGGGRSHWAARARALPQPPAPPSQRLICMGSPNGQWARGAGHAGSRAGPAGLGGGGGRGEMGPALYGGGGGGSGRRGG